MTYTNTLPRIVETLVSESLVLLKEIVDINSFSGNIAGNNKVQDVLQREFEALGLAVERVPCSGCGDILVARTAASGDYDILLLGHSDTVFPPTSPFQTMTREGDRVRGPGVCDMKGGLVTILLALKALKAVGRLDNQPLRVLINTDEEVGSVNSRTVFSQHARSVRAALVFETGKAENLVVTSRVGSRSFHLAVRGKSAHAGSDFSLGANAVSRIAFIVNELRGLTDLDQELTCNVGLIRGGEAVNVVPDFAEARFELRASEYDVLESATKEAEKIISRDVVPGTTAELSVVYTSRPFERTPETETLFRRYQQAGIRAGLEYGTNSTPIRGGSDANFFAGEGIPTIDALGPFGQEHHSQSEFMLVSSLAPKALNFLYWLLNEPPGRSLSENH